MALSGSGALNTALPDTITSIPAGLAKMNVGVFVIFTGLGALVWNGVLAGLGWCDNHFAVFLG